MSVRRTGDWRRAQGLLAQAGKGLGRTTERVLLREAHDLRALVVEGLDRQAPGGAAFAPLSPLTLASRRLRRMSGTKALIRTAELRNAIAVVRRGGRVFVGIPGSARGRDGRSIAARAEAQEYGTRPTIVVMTPAMRRYLARLLAEAGTTLPAGRGVGVVVLQTPARPFLRPATTVFQRGAGRRFLGRLAQALWGGRDGAA